MIEAKELRIGNYLMIDGKPRPVNANHILYLSNHPENSYTGVELSPEILEKARFVKNESNRLSLRISHALSLGEPFESVDSVILYAKGSISIPMNFRYLHELQNLYFALTSTELPINLNQ